MLTSTIMLLNFSLSLTEMVGDLFLPHDMPEPPKESFFRGLFGGGARSLDREELCELSSSVWHVRCHHNVAHFWMVREDTFPRYKGHAHRYWSSS
jgi:hypothetical protein